MFIKISILCSICIKGFTRRFISLRAEMKRRTETAISITALLHGRPFRESSSVLDWRYPGHFKPVLQPVLQTTSKQLDLWRVYRPCVERANGQATSCAPRTQQQSSKGTWSSLLTPQQAPYPGIHWASSEAGSSLPWVPFPRPSLFVPSTSLFSNNDAAIFILKYPWHSSAIPFPFFIYL